MKIKTMQKLLGIYDLILSAGAIYCGSLMIQSKAGVFASYPAEWLTKLPFDNWVIPGIIVVILFGAGNILAAVCSYRRNGSGSWIPSAVIGSILLLCLFASALILGKWYLAAIEFLVISLIQIFLSVYIFQLKRKNNSVGKDEIL